MMHFCISWNVCHWQAFLA